MKNILITLFISFLSFSSYAQVNTLKKANEAFKVYAFSEAASLYEQALYEEKNENKHSKILSRLGDCYYKISDSKKAAIWYQRALTRFPNIDSEYLWKYLQTLRSIKKYQEANEVLVIYKDRQKDDSRAEDFEFVNLESLLDPNSDKAKKVKLTNLNSNTENSDFDGYEINGKFFFSSANRIGLDWYSKKDKIYEWNKEPYLNVYEGTINKTNDDIKISEITKIPSDSLNLEVQHEGTSALTKDGNTLYFTGNNVVNGRRAYDNDKGRMRTSNLMLYRAIRINDKWEKVEKLPFNNVDYSTGHPTLSPDENTLYFVSDNPMFPDAQGQTDLYKVQIHDNGKFGDVINLKAINTVHREMFPFIAADSTLYFSSDGHATGLLDIFKSNILKRTDDESVTRENLGAPYNSGADDFAYFTNDNGKTGFFSSNRDGGEGSDDIYAFQQEDPCEKIISGITYGKAITDIDSKPLQGVLVELKDQAGNIMASTTSNENGIYVFVGLDHEKAYSISGEKVNYIVDSRKKPFTTVNDCKISQDLELISFEIGIVLFEFDKSKMNETMDNSITYLDNLIEIMQKYPNMKIRISSHTDLRGSRAYNEKLSQERAKSTYDYVINRINDTTRLSYGWFGECTPFIECGNYCDTQRPSLNKCTDDERKFNRRSEFEILNPEDIGLKQN